MQRKIQITTSYKKNFTSIPNFFIDHYLATANGDFVKVYIWLIKEVENNTAGLSVTSIADTFNLTENDVIRAIKYWHNAGVLEATWDERFVTSIIILDKEVTPTNQVPVQSSEQKTEKTPSSNAVAMAEPIIEARPDKPFYTTSQLVRFKTKDDYSQLVFVAESFLGKSLTENDLRILISLNDWLGLPFEVIEMLIEYCASNNHRKMNYIEKVAMDWADNQIDTLEKAEHRTKTHSKYIFTIFKALGIQNRNPVQFELDMIESWTTTFNMDVILEACNRTIKQTNTGSLKYTDKILIEWGKKHVTKFSDIESLDQAFKERKKVEDKQKTVNKTAKTNKFNNYNQRDYDFDQLEKQALELRMKQTEGN